MHFYSVAIKSEMYSFNIYYFHNKNYAKVLLLFQGLLLSTILILLRASYEVQLKRDVLPMQMHRALQYKFIIVDCRARDGFMVLMMQRK